MKTDISEFTAACAKRFCLWCGKPLDDLDQAFCCEACREKYVRERRKQNEDARVKNDTSR
jgi:predicted nucleic acid-binding Zn ribbon protein